MSIGEMNGLFILYLFSQHSHSMSRGPSESTTSTLSVSHNGNLRPSASFSIQEWVEYKLFLLSEGSREVLPLSSSSNSSSFLLSSYSSFLILFSLTRIVFFNFSISSFIFASSSVPRRTHRNRKKDIEVRNIRKFCQ